MPAIRGSNSCKKTRRRTRDVDQVYGDLRSARQLELHKAEVPDDEKAGGGQWHCIECARYFESENAYTGHVKSKQHKRRLKQLKDFPYTDKEADAAAGRGVLSFYEKKDKHEQAEKAKTMEIDVEM